MEYDDQIGLGGVDNGVVGELILSASFFDASSIGGGATNFVDYANNPVGGSLTVSGGTINRNANPETQWQISAAIAGPLTQGATTRNVNSQLLGEFLGNGAAYVTGEVMDTNASGSNDGFFVARAR